MSLFGKLLSEVMDVGAHERLLYSVLQFNLWCDRLVGEVEDVVQEGDVVESLEAASRRKPMFSKWNATYCAICELFGCTTVTHN